MSVKTAAEELVQELESVFGPTVKTAISAENTARLTGAGLGAGAGLFNAYMQPKKEDRNYLRDSLVGAGLGLGAGEMYNYANSPVQARHSVADTVSGDTPSIGAIHAQQSVGGTGFGGDPDKTISGFELGDGGSAATVARREAEEIEDITQQNRSPIVTTLWPNSKPSAAMYKATAKGRKQTGQERAALVDGMLGLSTEQRRAVMEGPASKTTVLQGGVPTPQFGDVNIQIPRFDPRSTRRTAQYKSLGDLASQVHSLNSGGEMTPDVVEYLKDQSRLSTYTQHSPKAELARKGSFSKLRNLVPGVNPADVPKVLSEAGLIDYRGGRPILSPPSQELAEDTAQFNAGQPASPSLLAALKQVTGVKPPAERAISQAATPAAGILTGAAGTGARTQGNRIP